MKKKGVKVWRIKAGTSGACVVQKGLWIGIKGGRLEKVTGGRGAQRYQTLKKINHAVLSDSARSHAVKRDGAVVVSQTRLSGLALPNLTLNMTGTSSIVWVYLNLSGPWTRASIKSKKKRMKKQCP